MGSSPAGDHRVRATLHCRGATQPLPSFPRGKTVVVRLSKEAPVACDPDVAGLPASCSAWLAPVARRPAAPTPASPQPAQPKEAPSQPEAGDTTFYLLCHTENHDTGALGLKEQLAPIRTVRTVVRLEPLAGKKEASQLISTHPLVNKPGPSTTDGEKVRASVPVDATAASTLWMWCPLHEMIWARRRR
jgi:hypothetical protein